MGQVDWAFLPHGMQQSASTLASDMFSESDVERGVSGDMLRVWGEKRPWPLPTPEPCTYQPKIEWGDP